MIFFVDRGALVLLVLTRAYVVVPFRSNTLPNLGDAFSLCKPLLISFCLYEYLSALHSKTQSKSMKHGSP